LTRSLLLLVLIFSVASITRDAEAQAYRVDTLARAPFAQYPMCLAFLPSGDGGFFFTEKNSGRVRLFSGSLQPRPVFTTPVESDGAQGLLGIAVHPSYPDTPYIFVYYVRTEDRVGIVERYRDSAGTGLDPTPLAIIPRRDAATENNGGILRFGPDGKLYVSVGDHRTHPETAQDTSSRHVPWGKILRFNTDGSYPADNPFPTKPFWALGLRCIQGMAFDAETGAMYCTDGGTTAQNCIYRVTKAGNFGWPSALPSVTRSSVKPLYKFPLENSPDLTGIAVYRADAFPRLKGKLLFTAENTPAVWAGTIVDEGDSLVVERLMTFPTGFSDLQVGPDGCLYLVNGPYLSSRILRINPVAPQFASTPPGEAVQGVRWSYVPTFTGTPPEVSLVSGPDGMTFDRETGSFQWVPTNAQALARTQSFMLKAQNGAGSVTQQCTIRVLNVNDPPTAFHLITPGPDAVFSFFARDPEITLRWSTSVDPDGDSIHYTMALDTARSFATPALRMYDCGPADSIRIVLPRVTLSYFWSVASTDGRFITKCTPDTAMFTITVSTPAIASPKPVRETSPAMSHEPVLAPQPNPTTTISYSLQKSGHVRISVFNILGEEMLRIVDATQQEGAYQFDLTKLDLPNGMYFYRLQTPGVFETKKVVLAR
jgi:glucose/arabinose dehydrogenase